MDKKKKDGIRDFVTAEFFHQLTAGVLSPSGALNNLQVCVCVFGVCDPPTLILHQGLSHTFAGEWYCLNCKQAFCSVNESISLTLRMAHQLKHPSFQF